MAEKKKAAETAETNTTETAESVVTAEAIETEKAATKTSQKKTVSNSSGFCVYIGPTIQGVIQSGTVYSGTREDAYKQLEAAIERYPLIAKMIVTGDTLATDRIKVKTPGNQLYALYHRLASQIKEGL